MPYELSDVLFYGVLIAVVIFASIYLLREFGREIERDYNERFDYISQNMEENEIVDLTFPDPAFDGSIPAFIVPIRPGPIRDENGRFAKRQQ